MTLKTLLSPHSLRTLTVLVLTLACAPLVVAARASAPAAVTPMVLPAAMVAPQEPAGGQDKKAATGTASAEPAEAEAPNDSWKPAIAKTINFLLLIGILTYYLRAPIATYLGGRSATIRKDLVDAATLRANAEQQLAAVRARLAELPSELEALTRRGQQELADEQVRMKDATAKEREKLLDRTHREIEMQTRVARRALVEHTAELAMTIARARIERDITPADQARLIDRYASEVRA